MSEINDPNGNETTDAIGNPSPRIWTKFRANDRYTFGIFCTAALAAWILPSVLMVLILIAFAIFAYRKPIVGAFKRYGAYKTRQLAEAQALAQQQVAQASAAASTDPATAVPPTMKDKLNPGAPASSDDDTEPTPAPVTAPAAEPATQSDRIIRPDRPAGPTASEARAYMPPPI